MTKTAKLRAIAQRARKAFRMADNDQTTDDATDDPRIAKLEARIASLTEDVKKATEAGAAEATRLKGLLDEQTERFHRASTVASHVAARAGIEDFNLGAEIRHAVGNLTRDKDGNLTGDLTYRLPAASNDDKNDAAAGDGNDASTKPKADGSDGDGNDAPASPHPGRESIWVGAGPKLNATRS